MTKPPVIDHNPFEKRYTNTTLWIACIGIAILWVGYFYFREPDIWSLALGGATGILLAAWGNEIDKAQQSRSRPRKPPTL